MAKYFPIKGKIREQVVRESMQEVKGRVKEWIECIMEMTTTGN